MKKAPLRWIMVLLSAAFIVYLWSTKDIAAQYADLPREELAKLALDLALRSYANQLACARILDILQPEAKSGKKGKK